MDIFDEKRKPQYMQALTAESNRAIDAIFTNRVQGEAKRRKEKSVSSTVVPEQCLTQTWTQT